MGRRELPGAGLLRDGQKWLIPYVLLAVLSAGTAVPRLTGALAGRLPHGVPGWPAALAALALPVVLLPDAPATLEAPLSPVHYPAEWRQVADRIRGSDTAVLVLPFGSYRSFGWAPGRTVLDPAPRWLPADTVAEERLAVSGAVLGGEDPAARRVAALLESGATRAALGPALAGQGIGWVVREAGTPGPPGPELSGLQPVLTGGAVELYRVPGQVRPAADQASRRRWVLGLDALVAALVLAAALVSIAGKARSARQRLLHSPVTLARRIPSGQAHRGHRCRHHRRAARRNGRVGRGVVHDGGPEEQPGHRRRSSPTATADPRCSISRCSKASAERCQSKLWARLRAFLPIASRASVSISSAWHWLTSSSRSATRTPVSPSTIDSVTPPAKE